MEIRKQLDRIIKAPFVYGDDFLPSEEMNKFLMELMDIRRCHYFNRTERLK